VIEILNYREVLKGSLLAMINIKVMKWGLILNKVGVFHKGNQKWISLPQEKFESNGETKYFPLVKFEEKAIEEQFKSSILNALDIFLKKNQKGNEEKNEQMPLPF